LADFLLGYYKSFNLDTNVTLRFSILFSPLLLILLFYLFVSHATSTIISFAAFVFSQVFILVSLWILCDILSKDLGPRSMQDIAYVIREGSEGFFVTQYGTIFKFAGLTSVGLFLMYSVRDIPPQSKLNDFFSPLSMALITSVSFLLGSVCSAISGYAGIWVSVRANLRVAAAARKCYNQAIQICFRGGAFAAIINVALAIFGISSLYLGFEFYFWM
jgi:Na+/H+-translocating membrane pyrophosphatase